MRSPAGAGEPVAAADPDGDTLTYSLSGDDAGCFEIDASTGQVWSKAPLDYETQANYTVVVSVWDGRDFNGEPRHGRRRRGHGDHRRRQRGRTGSARPAVVRTAGRRPPRGPPDRPRWGRRAKSSGSGSVRATGTRGRARGGPSAGRSRRPTRRWRETWATTCGSRRPMRTATGRTRAGRRSRKDASWRTPDQCSPDVPNGMFERSVAENTERGRGRGRSGRGRRVPTWRRADLRARGRRTRRCSPSTRARGRSGSGLGRRWTTRGTGTSTK